MYKNNYKQKLRLDTSNSNLVYNVNYWRGTKNIESHIKYKILASVDLMGKIRVCKYIF